MEPLSCVELEPPREARSAVIWLHGLGADGHDFEPIVPYLGLGDDLPVRFVFPHAPKRAVTINLGLIMRAWYDIRGTGLREDEDEKGIRESAEQIRALVVRENDRGVPAARIVLAGFSQGGAMALHVGLRHPEPLAGVLALSCYLVSEATLEREIAAANRGLLIFQAHGTEDPLVPLEAGSMARDRLVDMGYEVEWRTYPVGHAVHPQEIQDAGAWLRRVLGRALRSGDSAVGGHT
jgi:phospholipase/carboxylesterase